GNNQQNY
nr:Chain A, Eukaryotic peptide chain release factor GTP-binding subunit [synthetic construct]2OMM_A Chain A, GNNQQNY peptide corresponding to residues 7-13 of yeast prion sup35 [unidentified]5K2G_A Chain A, Eukaryotic peptide chain release factor GTP-binding subunit [Saccharomyces cerevisiae]5K2H_A Chain A, Eukaryotic peptide chain release factor GTP-binding subunit [Saccharomyces cerevisiae]